MIAPVSPCTRNCYKRFEEEDPRRFSPRRRKGAAAQRGRSPRSDRGIAPGFLFALIVVSFVFFLLLLLLKSGLLLFKSKFLVELGVDLSLLEAKRHSGQ